MLLFFKYPFCLHHLSTCRNLFTNDKSNKWFTHVFSYWLKLWLCFCLYSPRISILNDSAFCDSSRSLQNRRFWHFLRCYFSRSACEVITWNMEIFKEMLKVFEVFAVKTSCFSRFDTLFRSCYLFTWISNSI